MRMSRVIRALGFDEYSIVYVVIPLKDLRFRNVPITSSFSFSTTSILILAPEATTIILFLLHLLSYTSDI